jgi:hypothetical protein
MLTRRVACVLAAVLMTAIFPERFTLDPTAPDALLHVIYMMHVSGLAGMVTLLVMLPFLRVCYAARRLPTRTRMRALLPRATHVGVLLSYAVAFVVLRAHGADISDYCAPITPSLFSGAYAHRSAGADADAAQMAAASSMAADACNAWPALPPARCAELRGMHGMRGAPVPTRYTCAYVNESLSPAEAILYPPQVVRAHSGGRCLKARCKLLVHARSMTLEFGTLFLVGSYVTTYLRADLLWVTGGRAKSAAAAAGAAAQPHATVDTSSTALMRATYPIYGHGNAREWSMPHGGGEP